MTLQTVHPAPGVATDAGAPAGRKAQSARTPIHDTSRHPKRTPGLTEEDDRRLKALDRYRLSDDTRRAYAGQFRRFRNWMVDRGLEPLPAEPRQVAAYLAENFYVRGHKPATLSAAAAAIGFFHREAGYANPCDSVEVKSAVGGATRKAGKMQKQAEALTEQVWETLLPTLCRPRRNAEGEVETERTAMRRGSDDAAIIAVMRDGLLRVKEAQDLRMEDLTVREDGSGRALIRRSKTDPEGEGAVVYLSRTTMGYLRHFRSGASEKDGIFGLDRNSISRRIKEAARAAGLGDGFSGHSPRVGMARDLARAGFTLPELMQAGRWKSPRMPALYIREEAAGQGAVAKYNYVLGR